MDFITSTLAHWLSDKEFPLRAVRMEPQDNCAAHCHEFTELVLCYAGAGDNVTDGGDVVHVVPGDALLIPPGKRRHHYENLDNLCLVNLLFDLDHLPLPLLDACAMSGFNLLFNGQPQLFHLGAAATPRLLELVGQLERSLRNQAPGHQFEAMALFMLTLHMIAQSGATGAERTANASMAGALALLHQRFADPRLSMVEVAAAAKMSQSSLLRHFKRRTGCPPKEYLLKLRAQAACALLASTSLTMSEVAARCGFEDSNYFSREFKKIAKLTPTEFRTQAVRSPR